MYVPVKSTRLLFTGKKISLLRTNPLKILCLLVLIRILKVLTTFKTFFQYVAFTCGLLRGALANLGIVSLVTAEIQPMPAVKFHIEVKRN